MHKIRLKVFISICQTPKEWQQGKKLTSATASGVSILMKIRIYKPIFETFVIGISRIKVCEWTIYKKQRMALIMRKWNIHFGARCLTASLSFDWHSLLGSLLSFHGLVNKINQNSTQQHQQHYHDELQTNQNKKLNYKGFYNRMSGLCSSRLFRILRLAKKKL